MFINMDMSVYDIPFYSGAKDRVEGIRKFPDMMQQLNQILEDTFDENNPPTLGEVNDFVWFDLEWFFYPNEKEGSDIYE